MTTLKKPAAVQRKFMYWERGWGPEFEKHLGKTELFVIEVIWKSPPGLGRRQCALTPSSRRGPRLFLCRLVPFRKSGGQGVVTRPFPVAPSPAEEGPALWPPCVSFPSLQRIPAPQLGIPAVRQFLVWRLCTLHYGHSGSQKHRVFLPFPFGDNHREEIFMFWGPRQEPDMMLEAKAAPKDGGMRRALKHCTSRSTCPTMLSKI